MLEKESELNRRLRVGSYTIHSACVHKTSPTTTNPLEFYARPSFDSAISFLDHAHPDMGVNFIIMVGST
jgi:hypothetical protein